jgi:tetratricopeptide (TPR) repeat protein
MLGDNQEAKRLHTESLAIYRTMDNPWGIADTLHTLAIASTGLHEYEEAEQLFAESLARYREVGNLWGTAIVLGNTAEVKNIQGKYQEAFRLAEEGLAVSGELGGLTIIGPLKALGEACCGLGNLTAARGHFHAALVKGAELEATPYLLFTLGSVAECLAKQGENEIALELIALVLNHPASWQSSKDRAEALIESVEAELSPEVIATAHKRGAARDLEKTVTEMIEMLGE